MGSQGFLEGTYWLLEVPNRVPASAVTLGLPRPLERMADSKRMIRPREAQAISCPKIADLRAENFANLCPRIADSRRF